MQELLEEVSGKLQEKSSLNIYKSEETVFYDTIKDNGQDKLLEITIKEQKLAKLGATNYTVKTPNGSSVSVLKRAELSSKEIDLINSTFQASYPLAVYLSSATNKYNCHSYAWYKQSTNYIYWMNSPKTYVSDGSYKYVGTKPTAKSQKVVYKSQNGAADYWHHSGVVTQKSPVKITSKWGQGPLMNHLSHYCPYFNDANVLSYYKR